VLRQAEQTPARHDAAAQRRWEQLTERVLQARLDGDPDAQQAAEAQRRAYAEELSSGDNDPRTNTQSGPDRAGLQLAHLIGNHAQPWERNDHQIRRAGHGTS
jgi:hypothetical protein